MTAVATAGAWRPRWGLVVRLSPIANRRAAATLLVAGALLSAPGARADGLQLDAFVARVLADGLDAKAAATEVEAARAEAAATGIWPNPSAELSRQANAVGVRAGESQDQLVLSLPLAVSGRLGLLRDAADKDVEAARHRLAAARGRLRHQATAAYLEVAAARRRVEGLRAALSVLDPMVAAIAARERAGEASGFERIRIDLERKRLEDDLGAREADAARTLAWARALLGPGGEGAALAERDLAQPLGDGWTSSGALEDRGDARALRAEAEAARLQDSAAWRALIPEPTLYGGGTLLDLGRGESGVGYLVGLELPLPVFDRGQGIGARAQARLARVQAEREALVFSARARLAAGVAERTAKVERARRHDAEVRARADELLAITLAAYQRGGAELLALVDAERAQREVVLTSIDLHLASRLIENDLLILAGAYDDNQGGDAPGSAQP